MENDVEFTATYQRCTICERLTNTDYFSPNGDGTGVCEACISRPGSKEKEELLAIRGIYADTYQAIDAAN